MSGHRNAAAVASRGDTYELTVCDSEIPVEWRHWAATAHDGCPLCQRRAQAAGRWRRGAPASRVEPRPRKRTTVCGECERVLFAGLLAPDHLPGDAPSRARS